MNKMIVGMILIAWINSAYCSEVEKTHLLVSNFFGRDRDPIGIWIPKAGGKWGYLIEKYREQKKLGDNTKILLFVDSTLRNADDSYTAEELARASGIEIKIVK